ncbi:hypothetical protein BDW22DRAFT_1344832 [Trametopsis cervina]|nr:hypothetical protein BDW22DRAFT_1344832 [Trametopsis cervina]
MACATLLSHYSPFFSSGLLSNTSSAPQEPQPRRPTTHRSLPLSMTINTSTLASASASSSSLSLSRPRSATELSFKGREDAGYSFLTLESSGRRRHHHHKANKSSESGESSSISRKSTLTLQRSTPALRKSSLEHARVPCAKPAPLASLPAIPHRRPENLILVPVPALPKPIASSRRSSPPLADERISYFDISPPPTPPLTASFFHSSSSSSSSEHEYEYGSSSSRAEALAALEGRSPHRSRPIELELPRNFMSMTDEDDELEFENEGRLSSHFDSDSEFDESDIDVEEDEDEEDEGLFSPDSAVLPSYDLPWTSRAPPPYDGANTSAKRAERSSAGAVVGANFIDFRDDHSGHGRGWSLIR